MGSRLTGQEEYPDSNEQAGSESSSDCRPVIVLVRPQLGENIGASCRAMLNFGLEHLRIVEPRDGWPNPSAVAMASGAEAILERAQLYGTTKEALSGLSFVLATTARTRDMTKTVLFPRPAMQHAKQLAIDGNRVGIVFGPERSGLDNSDVSLADAIVTVPVNPRFRSLNISQSVLLLAYEWWIAADPSSGEGNSSRHPEPMAEFSEVQILADRLESELSARSFFRPESKALRMKRNLRNALSRMPLTGRDVRTVHGIIRTLAGRRPVQGVEDAER